MLSRRNVTDSSGDGDANVKYKVKLFSTVPAAAEDADTAEKKREGSTLVVNKKQRTQSPPCGADCDDDSDVEESFPDGRTDEVDRGTRGRAFAWCRDFLSGAWKDLGEDDFQISIVR